MLQGRRSLWSLADSLDHRNDDVRVRVHDGDPAVEQNEEQEAGEIRDDIDDHNRQRLEAFQAAYEEADFPEPAGPYAKYAYDATNILLAVIKEHGLEYKQQLAKAIREISHDGVLGTTTFDENGQTQIDVVVDIYEAKDGQWAQWQQ